MTAEEIDKMQAGRELDALIHQRVFGFKASPSTAWPYSTDITAAWLVVEKLREDYQFNMTEYWDESPPVWAVHFDNSDNMGCKFEDMLGTAEAAPLAICRAALKAFVGEQDKSFFGALANHPLRDEFLQELERQQPEGAGK